MYVYTYIYVCIKYECICILFIWRMKYSNIRSEIGHHTL